MKKKIMLWAVVVLIISGWVAFGVQYLVFNQQRARHDLKVEELESEINAYKFRMKDFKESTGEIKNVLNTLDDLKFQLEKLKNKIEKGEKNVSSKKSSENS